MLSRFIIILLCLLPFSLGAIDADCESALKELFKTSVNKEQAASFLKLQGDITLHRLAWAYLKKQKLDDTTQLENVERTILTLLDEKYTSTNPEFIKAREAFESQPLSRTTLADIAPFLKDVLSHEFKQEHAPFVLNASDLKVLSALAKHERANAKNGKYNSTMTDSKSASGMLNFMKIINASYQLSVTKEEEDLGIDLKLKTLEETLSQLQNKLADFVDQMEVPSACQDILACPGESLSDLFKLNEQVQEIFWTSLEDKLLSDDLLLNQLTYGEVWLKVGTGPKPKDVPVTPKTYQHTVIGNKTKASAVSPVKTFYTSSTGLLIDDPVQIIVKDAPGRKADNWKNFDKPYLQAMSDAILNDDKIFTVDGKMFERKTGRQISAESALALLPPGARAEFSKNLKFKDPAIMTKQITAKVNGDKTFIHKGFLYNLDGNVMSPEWTIGYVMTKKTGVTHEASRYKGMDHSYLVSRANALMNNKPAFVVNGQVHDTETGRNMSSPFRSLASTQDAKINKEKRVQYQNLSDKETIINFHRDRPKKDGCQHYAIVDKKNANITVYTLAGTPVFTTEVLLGKNVSDAKTRWTNYDEREQLASGTTGAGMFTIGAPKSNNYTKEKYSDNVLQVEGQKVFAIHQVPNDLKGRYASFGTGKPEDRRLSGGCVNLKQSDFLKLEGWIKPTCQVYVLPEEPNNKFVVQDGELKFTSTSYVTSPHLYNYSNSKSKTHAIDIRIINSNGNTSHSQGFVKALEDEKKKMMEVFNLSNEEYNDLASVAYGIMGNESDFGRSTKFWIKEYDQGDVILAKAAKRLFNGENPFDPSVLNTSRGFTQIKDLPDGNWKKSYPEVNKENLTNPRNSAVATIAYLVDAVKVLKNVGKENAKDPKKVKITKENLVDYLGYVYQGRMGNLKSSDDPANADFNTYVQKLKKHMSYIEIAQKID